MVTFVLILLLTLCHLSLWWSFSHISKPHDQKCLISCVQLSGWLLPQSVKSFQPCNLYFVSLLLTRMSSVEVNDENRGVCPGGKQNTTINDIFALDQPTGRPSILRQTENLPSKTMPKGTKVQNQLTVLDVPFLVLIYFHILHWHQCHQAEPFYTANRSY